MITLFWRTIRLISSDPALMMERLNTLNYRQLRPQRPRHQRINRSSSIMAGLNLTNMIIISHHFAGRTEFTECACSLYLPQTCTLYWWDTRNDLSVSAPGQVCSGYRIIIIIINTWIMTCQGSRVLVLPGRYDVTIWPTPPELYLKKPHLNSPGLRCDVD